MFLRQTELHNLIFIGTCISHEESNSNKLNNHRAKLTDGSCQSHNSVTHGVLVLIMFSSWKMLSQRVCNIQIRMYLANLYVSHRDLIADGIEASLDVFGSLVKPGFLH